MCVCVCVHKVLLHHSMAVWQTKQNVINIKVAQHMHTYHIINNTGIVDPMYHS